MAKDDDVNSRNLVIFFDINYSKTRQILLKFDSHFNILKGTVVESCLGDSLADCRHLQDELTSSGVWQAVKMQEKERMTAGNALCSSTSCLGGGQCLKTAIKNKQTA